MRKKDETKQPKENEVQWIDLGFNLFPWIEGGKTYKVIKKPR